MALYSPPNFPKKITIKDAARETGYSTGYISSLCRTGKVVSEYSHNEWLVDIDSLQTFVRRQAESKLERARRLAEARSLEYRRKVPVHFIREKIPKRLEAESDFPKSSRMARVAALATAFVIVASGAALAKTDTIPNVVREVEIAALQAAGGFKQTFGDIPARVIARFERPINVDASKEKVAREINFTTASIASPELANPKLAYLRMRIADEQFSIFNFSANGGPASGRQFTLAGRAEQNSISVEEFREDVLAAIEFASSPKNFIRLAISAHRFVGERAYELSRAGLNSSVGFFNNAGSSALTLGTVSRDSLRQYPEFVHETNLALASVVNNLAWSVIETENILVYGLAVAGPESARATVALLGGAGDTLARAAANAPGGAVKGFAYVTKTLSAAAPALAGTAFNVEYEVVKKYLQFADFVTDRYVALVNGTGRAVYYGAVGTKSIAFGIREFGAAIPSFMQDSYLATLGRSAAAVAAAPGRALSLVERAAFTTYKTLSGLVDSAGGALASIFVSPKIAIVSNVPETTPSLDTSVLDPVASSTIPDSRFTTSSAPARTQVITNYPTYTTVVNGLTQADMDRSLASLRTELMQTVGSMILPVANQTVTTINTVAQVARIETLKDTVITSPDFRKGTWSEATITSGRSISSTEGSFGTLSVEGATTISGTLAASGDISSPYFSATSTTATSTFAGRLAVGTSTPYGNGLLTVGTTSPLLYIDGDTGLIGMGTTSPSVTLAINGSQYVTAGLGIGAINTAPGSLLTTATTTALNFIASNLGTAGAPAYTFAGDLTTGIWSPAASTLAWGTGGTERMRLTPEGYLGLGTTTPYSRFSLWGSGTGTSRLFELANSASTTLASVLENGTAYFLGSLGVGTTSPTQELAVAGDLALDGTTGIALYGNGAGITFTGTGNHDITAAGGTLRIGSNTIIGNIEALDDTVDIGTPATRFDKLYANEVNATTLVGTLTGGNLTAETFSINSDNATDDTENSYLSFERGTVSPNALITWNSSDDRFDFNQPLYIENQSNSSAIVTLDLKSVAGQTADIFRIASSSGADLFNFSAAGKFGIGTTSPYSLLSISNSASTPANTPLFTIASTTAGNSTTTLMTVLANGYVGINRANPGTTLDVGGTVTSTGFVTSGQYAYAASSGFFYSSRPGLVTTPKDSFVAINATAATVGVPVQMSPRIRMTGTVWDTGVAASRTVNFENMVMPTSGAPGSARLLWGYDYNGTSYDTGTYSELMSLTSAGSLGLGTTSPYSLLSISNSASTPANTPLFTIASTTAGTATSTLMTVLANGRVGIGIASPVAQLNTYKTETVGAGLGAWTAIGDTRLNEFDLVGKYVYGVKTIVTEQIQGAAMPGVYGVYSTATTNTGLAVGGYFSATAESGDAYGLLVDAGFVGIGTTTPLSRLHVDNGQLIINKAVGTLTQAPDSSIKLFINSGTNDDAAVGFGIRANGSSVNYALGLDDSDSDKFKISAGLLGTNDRFVIDSSGNIGIGTSTPYSKLSVWGGSTGNIFEAVTNASSTAMVIDTAGNVGIGTSTPAASLHVNNSVSGGTLAIFSHDSEDSATPLRIKSVNNGGYYEPILETPAALRISATYNGTTNQFRLLPLGGSIWFQNTNSAGTTYFSGLNGANSADVQFKSTRASFNGSVGIGTTSPYSLLSISNSATTAANTPLFTIASTTAGNSTTTLMTVLANGNIGIGSATPSSRLFVSGDTGTALIATTTLSAASGNENAFEINYTTNKAAGDDTGLKISMIDSSSPGTSNLIDAKVGASSQFKVSATGNMYLGTGIETAYYNAVSNNQTIFLQGRSFTAEDNAVDAVYGTASNSSGQFNGFVIRPTYNQSGTAAATDLLVRRSETAAGSGNQYLLDLQVGGSLYSYATTSKMVVTNTGFVGIGTTSPYSLLSISNSAATAANTPLFTIASTTAGTATSTLLTVLADGRVAVGTGAIAASKLSVWGGFSSPGVTAPTGGTVGTIYGNEIIGEGALTTSTAGANVIIGYGAAVTNALNNTTTACAFCDDNVVIGAYATSTHRGNTVIGARSSASGTGYQVIIGSNLTGTQQYGINIGNSNTVTASTGFSIGRSNSLTLARNFQLGWGLSSNETDEIAMGFRDSASSSPALRIMGATSIYTGRNLFRINTGWEDSMDATRKGAVSFSTYDTVERIFMSATTTGSSVNTSFYGGNVGIGTTSPAFLLQLASSTAPQLALSDGSFTSNHWTLRNLNNYLYVATATPSTFATSTYTALTIDPNGRLGIGSTNPNNLLDLYSTGKAAIGFSGASGDTYKWTIGMDVANGGRFAIASSTALGTNDIFTLDGAGNSAFAGTGTTTFAGFIDVNGTGANATSTFASNLWVKGALQVGTGSMFLTDTGLTSSDGNLSLQRNASSYLNGGNFGIGTTSPYSLLSISNSATTAANTPLFTIASTTAGTATSTLMSVLANGNVGIGKKDPAEKLDIRLGNLKFDNIAAPSATTVALGGAGSLSGTYAYRISYVTADGLETEAGASSASVAPSTQQVNLSNIPVSSDSAVTARKIYRNKDADGIYKAMYLVATISDNSTTTYTDDTADGSLGVANLYLQTTGGILYTRSTPAAVINSLVTSVGVGALDSNQAPSNSAFGYGALTANTTGGFNNAFGQNALDSNISGNSNNAFGTNALSAITTGSTNSAFGNNALQMTTGSSNAGFGANAIQNNTAGTDNTAVGVNSLSYTQTGSYNTAVGSQAGRGVATNSYSYNSIFGSYAGYAITTGSNNLLAGYRAGDELTTGSNNIVIGYDIDAPSNTGSNQLNIGNLLFGTGLNGADTTVSTGNIGIGTTTPYSKLSVWGGSTGNIFEAVTSASSTALIVNATGNIGIGTTSPSEMLAVAGNIQLHAAGDNIYLNGGKTAKINYSDTYNVFNVVGNTKSYVVLGTNGGGDSQLLLNSDTAGAYTDITSAGAYTALTARGAGNDFQINSIDDDVRFFTNSVERLSIKNAGNIGIGTTSPYSLLSISNSAATPANTPLFTIASTTAGNSTTTLMTVLANGNVGIGTSSPYATLSVNGFINTDGVTGGYKIDNNLVLQASTTNSSTLVGQSAGANLFSSTTAAGNSAFGYQSLKNATSSSYNTAVGYQALTSSATVSNTGFSTAVGYQALTLNSSGSNNTATGYLALSKNTTGSYSNAYGANALLNSYGSGNNAFGYRALRATTWGSNNSAFGESAMINNATGSYNSAFGSGAIGQWSTGTGNSAFGAGALYGAYSATPGSNNTGIGRASGNAITSGSNNLFVGAYVASTTATGSYNIAIGYDIALPVTNGSNQLNIGNLIFGTGIDGESTTLSSGKIGIGTTTPYSKLSVWGSATGSIFEAVTSASTTAMIVDVSGSVGINDATPDYALDVKGTICQDTDSNESCDGAVTSDERLKTNVASISGADALAQLGELRGVRFDWDESNPATEFLGRGVRHVGVIAQEVEVVYPSLVYQDVQGYKMVDYQKLTGPLISAVNELNTRTRWMENAATSTVMTVDVAGNMGIGTTMPTHTLEIAGDVAAISFINTSTRSAKKDINYANASSTEDMLARALQLKVASYRYKIESDNKPLYIGLIAEDAEAVAPEILSPDSKGVDIYKLATLNLASIQALAAKLAGHETRLVSLEDRVTALESGAVSSASGSPLALSSSTLASALEGFGVLVRNGIAQFNSLVFHELIASTDEDGTSSAGSVVILAGNTVAQVQNSLVKASTKIFVTFNTQVEGSWWVSDKATGSFRVVLSAAQTTDVAFDYFLVQTEGQIATSTPISQIQTSDVLPSSGSDRVAPVITLLGENPVRLAVGDTFSDPGVSVDDGSPIVTYINGVEEEVNSSTISTGSETTYIITYRAMDTSGNLSTTQRSIIVGGSTTTSTPDTDDTNETSGETSGDVSANTDSAAPVVTLTGAAAMEIVQGEVFADPGATAIDPSTELGASDTDLTSGIEATGSVDTATPGLYTLTYSVTDAAGNTGTASRVVTVVAAPTSSTSPDTPTEHQQIN